MTILDPGVTFFACFFGVFSFFCVFGSPGQDYSGWPSAPRNNLLSPELDIFPINFDWQFFYQKLLDIDIKARGYKRDRGHF